MLSSPTNLKYFLHSSSSTLYGTMMNFLFVKADGAGIDSFETCPLLFIAKKTPSSLIGS